MSLLKTVISEMAAAGCTGAGAVATTPGSLFAGGITASPSSSHKKRGHILRRVKTLNIFPHLKEAMGIDSGKTKFNAADVVSKLDAAQTKSKNEHDTTTFGLEDENGNMVKVYVRKDQADQFDHALAAMLGQSDENADDKNSSLEIAEVLFDLKDKFEIVDVDWGQIYGDEEEEQEVEPDAEGGAEGMEGGAEGAEGEGGEMTANQQQDMDGMDAGGGDEDVKSLLNQVIDVLKSQAEANKAEADARTAEAKAKEAEFAARAAEAKIRQEEETIEMEDYYKNKQEQKKEAQRLAKLAKFKHDKAKEADQSLNGGPSPDIALGGEESEERSVVSPRELAATIFRQLKGH